MKKVVHIGENDIVLISKDIIDELDMDQITSIDHSNLYGEIVTCSVLLNKIGLLKAEVEAQYNYDKMNCEIYESKLRESLRRESILNGGKVQTSNGSIKLTESSLDELILLDLDFQKKKKNTIESKKNLDMIDSLYWAIQSKDKKLTNLVPKVTPKEFYDELIEGTVNSFIIKKI